MNLVTLRGPLMYGDPDCYGRAAARCVRYSDTRRWVELPVVTINETHGTEGDLGK